MCACAFLAFCTLMHKTNYFQWFICDCAVAATRNDILVTHLHPGQTSCHCTRNFLLLFLFFFNSCTHFKTLTSPRQESQQDSKHQLAAAHLCLLLGRGSLGSPNLDQSTHSSKQTEKLQDQTSFLLYLFIGIYSLHNLTFPCLQKEKRKLNVRSAPTFPTAIRSLSSHLQLIQLFRIFKFTFALRLR